ncbi:MAG TPA: ornithine carbamoyltransferase [Acidimicrobiia bacterium]|nr:ornithine carbamoyltransferase [Acidimicrobiia bacterium]
MNDRFLEVDDLDAAGVARVLDRAVAWKADPSAVRPVLAGKGVAALFEKPSTRTRVSFEMAVHTLGGHPISLRNEEVGLGARETAPDVARTLAGYCAAIGARVFRHGVLEEMADAVGEWGVRVVNLLSDEAHPLQAMADLMTLLEHWGSLEGRRIAYVGDGNNVAASLAIASAMTGLEVVVSSPAGYELDDEAVERARNLGGTVDLVSHPHEAVAGVDAVYTDVWASMGQEDEADARKVAFENYRVDERLMGAAGSKALFLHCLPAHRGEEVTDAVIDGPQSVVWQQAANRMHAARSVLAELLTDGEA